MKREHIVILVTLGAAAAWYWWQSRSASPMTAVAPPNAGSPAQPVRPPVNADVIAHLDNPWPNPTTGLQTPVPSYENALSTPKAKEEGVLNAQGYPISWLL